MRCSFLFGAVRVVLSKKVTHELLKEEEGFTGLGEDGHASQGEWHEQRSSTREVKEYGGAKPWPRQASLGCGPSCVSDCGLSGSTNSSFYLPPLENKDKSSTNKGHCKNYI